MSLQFDDPEVEALALELAKRTGQPVSRAVVAALRAQLVRPAAKPPGTFEDALAVARRCSRLPDLDRRSADEILGYNAQGLWD